MPMSSNTFPHVSNAHNIGGSDVRSHGKDSNQDFPGATIQEEFSNHVFPQSQLALQGRQQLQQRKQFWKPQELHDANWQFTEQRHRQQLEYSRQQSMQPESQIGFPETSYSALLHCPDTPPSQPEPGWDTPLPGMKNHGSWSVKGILEKDQGSLYGGGGRLAFNPGTPHILPEQFKREQVCTGVPAPQILDPESAVKSQRYLNPFAGHKIQYSGEHLIEQSQVSKSFNQSNHQQGFQDLGMSQQRSSVFPDKKWDGQQQSSFQPLEGTNASLRSTGQNSSIAQQHGISMSIKNENMGFSHLQSQESNQEGSSFKQQEVNSFPYRGMPTAHESSDFGLQQYNCWSAPQAHAGFGIQMQPPADVHCNGWEMSAWQGCHNFVEDTSCLSYASANMQLGPNHVQYGWQGGPADVQYRWQGGPEGYYSSATSSARQEVSFGSGPETGTVIPSLMESYSEYHRPQVSDTYAKQVVADVGMPGNGAGHSNNWTGFSGKQDDVNQELRVDASGKTQHRQLQSNHFKGPHVSQPANNVMNARQEHTLRPIPDGNGDKESSSYQKGVDLEGPRVKKQRKFSEVNSPQKQKLRQGPSSNLRSARPLSGGPGVEAELDQGSRTSGEIKSVFQRPGTPSTFSGVRVKNSAQAEIPSSVISRPVCSSENSGVTQEAGTEKIFSGTGKPSQSSQGVAIQVMPFSQYFIRKPSNVVEDPKAISTSSVRSQYIQDVHNAQLKYAHDQFPSVEGSEFACHLLFQEPRPSSLTPVNGVHPSFIQAPVQRPELNQLEQLKAAPLDNGGQLREKCYPPPTYQSQPVQSLGESRYGEQPFFEAWATRIYESTLTDNVEKEMAAKPVNHPSHYGIMEQPPFYYPAGGDSVPMGTGMALSDSGGMQKQVISSSEEVSANNQQTVDTNIYSHMQSPDMQNNIFRGAYLRSMVTEAQGSATRNELLEVSSLASAYPDPRVCGREPANLAQLDGDQNQVVGYRGHHVEHSSLRNADQFFSMKVAPEHLSQHRFLKSKSNVHTPNTVYSKKRKKPVSFITPWHIAASQPKSQLPSISKAELMWASAGNCLPEKDGGEFLNEGMPSTDSRLRLTTQLMQQLILPLPIVLMHGNKPINFECGVYSLAKSALGEVCRLMAGAEREMEPTRKGLDIRTMTSQGQTRVSNMPKDIAMIRLVEKFMERVKLLDFELARFDCSMSALELRNKIHDLENLSIVNRLGKHHSLQISENIPIESIAGRGTGIRRSPPQKYVVAVPMSRILPEGVRCLSL